MNQLTASYGSWASPISSDLIAGGSVRLSQVALRDGSLYWLESRPTEGGRYALVRRGPDGTVEDVTPADFNVRTRVHEYGGASYSVTNGAVFFSNYGDQQLYRQDRGDDPIAITLEPPETASERFADAQLTPDGRTIISIRERHLGEHDVVNELVSIPSTGGGQPVTIAAGHDFYAYPRISPDGKRLAWIVWDHPRMPWDGTELWLADLAEDGSVSNERHVAGGPQESIFQPEWSADGALHFVSDRTGWWNLYRLDGGEAVALAPMDAEFGGPQWGLDAATYTFISGGRIASVVTERGMDRLCIVTPGQGVTATLDLPLNSIGHIAGDGGNFVALLAAGPELPGSVLLVNVDSGDYEIARRSNDTQIDAGYLSAAQPIEFPTTGGKTAHAFYYAPRNRDARVPEGELPPLVVFSHGGPTGATSPGLNLSIQFWTSRGIAVVDVNYGGSTGYGREYRERLRGNWGIVDIDDCVNAARYLVEQGLADPRRMAIRGGSAGGYTTLAALCFTDTFSAGASYYGVADLEALARDTHKFESRYLDSMIGPWPQEEERYRERSPVHHTEKLSCPMIVFQGLEDKVVPPSQAEMMVEALKKKGLPHAYLPFEGEQHGFRRAENIKRSLDAELYFYARVFGFETADEIEPVEIVNL